MRREGEIEEAGRLGVDDEALILPILLLSRSAQRCTSSLHVTTMYASFLACS